MVGNLNPQGDSSPQSVEDIKELTTVVQDLISMMGKGNIESLQLSYGSLQLSLQSGTNSTSRQSSDVQERPAIAALQSDDAESAGDPGEHIIAAPMIGTFYVAPAPNEPAFVSPGDHVEEGQTIGIIEAMKILNEIAADRTGKVLEIIASDGQTVEYGSPLLRIEPSTT